mmetsp:Transcript_32248/g.79626  ORF Transcript_32248/g.79626 Transcript_32248/m.79626 type:complete len:224 (-) Transcript_32248:148-819(-)
MRAAWSHTKQRMGVSTTTVAEDTRRDDPCFFLGRRARIRLISPMNSPLWILFRRCPRSSTRALPEVTAYTRVGASPSLVSSAPAGNSAHSPHCRRCQKSRSGMCPKCRWCSSCSSSVIARCAICASHASLATHTALMPTNTRFQRMGSHSGTGRKNWNTTAALRPPMAMHRRVSTSRVRYDKPNRKNDTWPNASMGLSCSRRPPSHGRDTMRRVIMKGCSLKA